MIQYSQRRTPVILSDGIHDFGVLCANCAERIAGYYAPYIEAVVHGEDVVVCSSRCLATLQHVWAPTQRVLPWREAGVCVALFALALL